MPFIPHTEADTAAMLAAIGVDSIEALFDEVPATLRAPPLNAVPAGLNEAGVTRLLRSRAARNALPVCFAGAGAYDHHVPAAVWQIATRGEFYSAYTPYQAEASQGTLQVIYEFQSMLTTLLDMEVANASLYDGASALAEAVLMAVRLARRPGRVLLPRSLHPHYRQVVRTLTAPQQIELVEVDYDRQTGQVDLAALAALDETPVTVLVVPQPNVFGVIEPVDALVDWAQERQALTIAAVNPIAMALLPPPGRWGSGPGADIVVGEGQPLGVPLSAGGPYFGFMAARQAHVRQMPGRIVGRTRDLEGRVGYTLTLQPREQHIRRGRATSNICTNQGLMVTAATIYMALMGGEGLRRTAIASHARLRELLALLAAEGVRPHFTGPCFHEAALALPQPAATVRDDMLATGVLGGVPLDDWYPELGPTLLACTTEQRESDDLSRYQAALREALA